MNERLVGGAVCLFLAGWALFTLNLIAFFQFSSMPESGGVLLVVVACVLVALLSGVLGIGLLGAGFWPRSSGLMLFWPGLAALVVVLPLRLGAMSFLPYVTEGVVAPPELLSNWRFGGPLSAGLIGLGLVLWISGLWIRPHELEE